MLQVGPEGWCGVVCGNERVRDGVEGCVVCGSEIGSEVGRVCALDMESVLVKGEGGEGERERVRVCACV